PLASRNLPGLALEADVLTGVAVDVDLGGRLPGVAAVGVSVEPQPAEVVLQGAGRLLVGQLDPALVRVVSRAGPGDLAAQDVAGHPDAPVQWAVGRPVTLLHAADAGRRGGRARLAAGLSRGGRGRPVTSGRGRSAAHLPARPRGEHLRCSV